MSKTNSAVLRCHFHWLLDQRSASNRETTLRIYLKIIKRVCVCVCPSEGIGWTRTLFHREKNIYSQVFHPLDHPRYEHFINPLWLYYRVSFFLPLYFYSCGYKCNMNPATNAKPNNGTLKILIASLPTHSYEHTHTKKPKTVIKQQSNNAYKLFITWHEFKPSFCLLLLLTAVHVVSPCSFCFFILCFIPAT